MGATLSSNDRNAAVHNRFEPSQKIEPCKRRKTYLDENSRLIPNLPDEISIQILARLPRITHQKAKLVSRRWRATLSSEDLFDVRKELGKTEQWLYVLTKLADERFAWYALDPSSSTWQKLPPMPNSDMEGGNKRWTSSAIRMANLIKGWFVRKSPFCPIPFYGCAVTALDGSLYVMGGCSQSTALKSVFRYSPALNSWTEVKPMSTGRAYCQAGVLNDKIYVAGGVSCSDGGGQLGFSPIQSAEVFDPISGQWCEIPKMPFSKARGALPTAFLADLLKPMATGMATYKGKLYVPQSLYCWPFFVDVGGEAYDPGSNSWVEMPAGMGEGWPAKQTGSKPSAVVKGELYALEPSEYFDGARVKVYYQEIDEWRTIEGDFPSNGESAYLLAGMNDVLHVITKGSNGNMSVLRGERRDKAQSTCVSLTYSSGNSNLGESLHEFYGSDSSSMSLLLPWAYAWRVIAGRGIGSGEIVGCQVVDV